MAKISKETIERIQNEVSIIDVMENYTKIVKKNYGNSYTGFCPFHNDVRTPSMSIDADRKIWHCFTCSESGNLFQFIQKKESVNFVDSIKILAEKYGIPLEYDSPEDAEAAEERVSFYEILKIARNYFVKELEHSELAKEYLKGRNFNNETIKRWNIGWAPGGNSLYKELKKHGYSDDILVESGLVSFSEHKKDYQDVFFSRVVFPINDVLGRPVGFGGRTLNPDGKPKYLNSKENPVFHKRKTLFGMDSARKDIQNKDEVIVAEGYVDAIMMHQHGLNNTVGALGTAFTVDHILSLSRMTKNIYLCLDSDKAGKAAANRVIDLMNNTDANIYVIEIPENMAKDPDEFLQKYSAEEFNNIKKKAVSIQRFAINTILDRFDLTNANTKDRAYNEVLKFIETHKKLFSMFQGIESCELIATRLNMPVSGHELYQSIFNKVNNTVTIKRSVEIDNTNISLEMNLLRLLLDYPELLPIFSQTVKAEYFVDENNKKIYEKLVDDITSGKNLNLVSFNDEALEKHWNKFLITHPTVDLSDKQSEQSAKRIANALKRTFLERKLEALVQEDGDMQEMFKIKMDLAKIPVSF